MTLFILRTMSRLLLETIYETANRQTEILNVFHPRNIQGNIHK